MRVLLVEDDLGFASSVKRYAELRGHEVTVATYPSEAFDHLGMGEFDVVISDWDLGPGGYDGLDVLEKAHVLQPASTALLLWSGVGREVEISRRGGLPPGARFAIKSDIEVLEELLP